MSESYTHSEKSKGKLGIARIFKQSVRDLGQVSKADVLSLRKESSVSKQDKVTDNDSVNGKKDTSLSDHKEIPRETNYRDCDKSTVTCEEKPNNIVESLKSTDFRSSSTTRSERKQKFIGFRKAFCNQNSILDENRNKRDEVGKFQGVTESVNVINGSVKDNNIKVDGVEFENWDNELIDIKIVDEKFPKKQGNTQQKIHEYPGDNFRSFVETDINNNCIELDIAVAKNIGIPESESKLEPTLIDKSPTANENNENTHKVSEVIAKEFGGTDLDIEQVQKVKECISDGKNVLYHSTPKKEDKFVHVLEKELGTSCLLLDKLENDFTPVVKHNTDERIKGTLQEFTGNIDSGDCLEQKERHNSEGLSKMRRYSNISRTFERGDDHYRSGPSKNFSRHPRNHPDFNVPPRFKSSCVNGEGDKVEKADAYVRNGRGNDFWHKSQKDQGFRNFNRGEGLGSQGKQEEMHNRMQLLDLKIKTPMKFKSVGSGIKKMESACRVEVESRWEMPVFEDWSSELLDIEAIDINSCALNTMDDTVDIDNPAKSCLQPMSPVSQQDVGRLEPKEFTLEEVSMEQNAHEKRLELQPEKSHHVTATIEARSSYGQNDIGNKGTSTSLKTEVLLPSQAQNVYLPPIPDEVLAAGDQEIWTTEINRKWENVNECKISHKGSEGNADIVVKVQKENTRLPFKTDSHQDAETDDVNKFHEESESVKKNMQGIPEEIAEKAESDTERMELQNNPDVNAVERNLNRIEFTEDKSSLSSVYVKQDHICVNSSIENMPSEAESFDFPDSENKGFDNERNGVTMCKKPGKEREHTESTLANVEVNRIGYDASRDVYDQYASYLYEQESMNADYMQRGQYDSWHPNYPFNYDAGYRWSEQLLMNYYWDMYNWQMQCGGQVPYYWYEPYLCQDNFKIGSGHAGNTVEDKTVKQGESKHTENRREKKRSGHGFKKDHSVQINQFKTTDNCLDHADELDLREYKCERMHQWVKNHSPEVTNDKRSSHFAPASSSECSQEESYLHLRKPKDDISSDFDISKTNFAYSDKSSSLRQKKKRDQVRNERNSVDGEKISSSKICEKPERSCTCKPSQVKLMVWRTCACEVGNPARLHKVLPSGFDERSLDLGYQSIESLEHDEYGNRQISGKAPGFEILPLCSTPVLEDRNIDLLNHKKVRKEKSELCKSKGGDSESSKKIRPPPGFERVVSRGMEYSNSKSYGQDKESEHYGRPDNAKTMKPSLMSIIQQQGLQHGQYVGTWQGVNNTKTRQKDSPVSKEDNNNNFEDQNILGMNSSFPVPHSTNIRHRSKACSSIEEVKYRGKDSTREISELSGDRSNFELQIKKRGISVSRDLNGQIESMRNDGIIENFINDVIELPAKGKGIDREYDYMCENEQQDKVKVKDMSSSVISVKSKTYESSSADHCETSGDENIQFSVLTQSPENELNNDYADEEIPVNEIMESEIKRGKTALRSGEPSREDFEIPNRTRMSFRPRSPYVSFPPPYRGCPFRPRFPPFSHMEQWQMDPRLLTMPPPVQWSPPSPYQMYSPGPALGPNEAREPTRPILNESISNHRMFREGNVKPLAPFPQYNPTPMREYYKDSTKGHPVEERKRSGTTQKGKPSKGLVDYDSVSSEESSSEIEPFDVNSLRDSGEETAPQMNQMKPTPKKLKTDTTDDDLSSSDSFHGNEKENRNKLHSNATGAIKLSRGHCKKLRQKTLKSFSSTERQQTYQKIRGDTPKQMVQDHIRKRSLADIIAETGRAGKSERRLANDTTSFVSHDFRQHDSEQEKKFPSLPPLPPFPNSPFWSMYPPADNSALTGKSKEDDNIKTKVEETTTLPVQRKWLPKCPSQRYLFSPGQAGGVNSPSETDSESRSIKSDWMTNFKVFHDFGVKYIDTHCHLDFLFSREGFKGTFRGYMDKHAETFPDMFEGCVAVFCNPNTFIPNDGLWFEVAKEPNVWIAMGCHPKMATDFTGAAELGLKKCLHHSKCIALGEIGLDYSGTFHQHEEVQKQVFRKQLKMALQLEKVLVIHCRQAEEDCLEIMKEMVPRNWKIHCHCFTNEYKNAKLWIDAFPNLFIGVTPLVTYRTARPSHDLARNIPINKLLLETDAPYFVPRCVPKEDLQLSNPGLAITVAKEIAQYQEIPVAAVLRQCRLNTKFMYGI